MPFVLAVFVISADFVCHSSTNDSVMCNKVISRHFHLLILSTVHVCNIMLDTESSRYTCNSQVIFIHFMLGIGSSDPQHEVNGNFNRPQLGSRALMYSDLFFSLCILCTLKSCL